MNREKRTHPFKVCQTGYHEFAVIRLANWLNGIIEYPFKVDNNILFISDIACFENGILNSIYEVVYSYPLTGRKLGLIEYWCYLNSTSLIVYEISADFILKQIAKPDIIQTMEMYIIDPLYYSAPPCNAIINCDPIVR